MSSKSSPHTSYYIRGGDLYILIDQTLFRIHSHFFLRESGFWKNELLVSSVSSQKPVDEPFKKGSSASDPYVLKNETSADFSRFLWVFYNTKYGDFSKAKRADWIVILRLASLWEFSEIKSLAVDHLEQFEMDLIQRIQLYTGSHVHEKYLFPLYVQLASRDEVLGLEEARTLGIETFVLVQQARERLRGPASSLPNSPQSPIRVGIQRDEIVNTVATTFSISLADVDVTSPGNAIPTLMV